MDALEAALVGHHYTRMNNELENKMKAASIKNEMEFCGVRVCYYENHTATFIFPGRSEFEFACLFAEVHLAGRKVFITDSSDSPFVIVPIILSAEMLTNKTRNWNATHDQRPSEYSARMLVALEEIRFARAKKPSAKRPIQFDSPN